MSDPEVVVRLLAAIDEREKPELIARGDHELRWTMGDGADTWRVECHHCDWSAEGPERVINPAGDQHARECVSMPTSDVLRLCQSHRDIVAMFPVSAPKIEYGGFAGFESRDCGDHRTVGPHRAWCFDCSEWCYPNEPCRRCHGVSEVIRVLARGYGIEDGEPT